MGKSNGQHGYYHQVWQFPELCYSTNELGKLTPTGQVLQPGGWPFLRCCQTYHSSTRRVLSNRPPLLASLRCENRSSQCPPSDGQCYRHSHLQMVHLADSSKLPRVWEHWLAPWHHWDEDQRDSEVERTLCRGNWRIADHNEDSFTSELEPDFKEQKEVQQSVSNPFRRCSAALSNVIPTHWLNAWRQNMQHIMRST